MTISGFGGIWKFVSANSATTHHSSKHRTSMTIVSIATRDRSTAVETKELEQQNANDNKRSETLQTPSMCARKSSVASGNRKVGSILKKDAAG